MRDLKLTDSQKLCIYIGCASIFLALSKDIETEPDTDSEIRSESYNDEVSDKHRKIRPQIVETLEKHSDVQDVHSLFEEPPLRIAFNPIVLTLQIPFSLQKDKYRSWVPPSETEEFFIVYDGIIMIVAAISSLEERPYGVYDARDKIVEIMKNIAPNIDTTAPSLAQVSINFVNKPKEIDENIKLFRDIYLEIKQEYDVFNAIKQLYFRLFKGLLLFYEACHHCETANEIVLNISKNETELVQKLIQFLQAPWHHLLEKREIISKLKLNNAKILENLSIYSDLITNLLEDNLRFIQRHRAHNELFDEFIEKVNLDYYTKPQNVNSDSIIRIVEHVRCETEMFSSFMSALISTFVGVISVQL